MATTWNSLPPNVVLQILSYFTKDIIQQTSSHFKRRHATMVTVQEMQLEWGVANSALNAMQPTRKAVNAIAQTCNKEEIASYIKVLTTFIDKPETQKSNHLAHVKCMTSHLVRLHGLCDTDTPIIMDATFVRESLQSELKRLVAICIHIRRETKCLHDELQYSKATSAATIRQSQSMFTISKHTSQSLQSLCKRLNDLAQAPSTVATDSASETITGVINP